MATDLLDLARGGDGEAFAELVEPYRRELQVHCYRILGSAQDAEDALQEAMLAAWRGLAGFEGRASLRSWLYRVATNRCLNALRASAKDRRVEPSSLDVVPPEPSGSFEVPWLEPYPDVLLEGIVDQTPGPEARIEAREAISLAFVTALQMLAPRQRTVLVLRDVLGFPATDVAAMLETTEESVTSALKRARSKLHQQTSYTESQLPPPAPNSREERAVVERLTRAYESADLEAVVALLTDDVKVSMPPMPLEYHGRELATRFLQTVSFRPGRAFRLVPTRANGQPAFGYYVRDPHGDIFRATGLFVVTLAGRRISGITRFDNSVLDRFGLPRVLPIGGDR